MPTDGSPPRFCIINDDTYPSRWTNTQQTIKTAAALAGIGTQVELVIPRPMARWFDSSDERRRAIAQYYGVETRFDLTQIPGPPKGALRVSEALHGILAPLYARCRAHDVVYSRNITAIAVALATGQPVVFESHRLLRQHYPAAYRVINVLRRHPLFLGVVTNARLIADSFIEMGFPRDAVAIAHNCYDPRDVLPRLTRSEARTALGLPLEGKVVCYAGHIQRRKGIATVIQMAARTPDVRYLICGGFPQDVAEARAIALDAGATNIVFTGWIDMHKLSPYLYAADVLLIPPTSAPLRRHGNTVLPIKTYTYLAIGRAILAPDQEDTTEVLQHGRNGWLVAPDDLDAAVEGIRRLCADEPLAERLGEAASRDAELYTWERRAHTIRHFVVDRLNAVVRPRSAALRRVE